MNASPYYVKFVRYFNFAFFLKSRNYREKRELEVVSSLHPIAGFNCRAIKK